MLNPIALFAFLCTAPIAYLEYRVCCGNPLLLLATVMALFDVDINPDGVLCLLWPHPDTSPSCLRPRHQSNLVGNEEDLDKIFTVFPVTSKTPPSSPRRRICILGYPRSKMTSREQSRSLRGLITPLSESPYMTSPSGHKPEVL